MLVLPPSGWQYCMHKPSFHGALEEPRARAEPAPLRPVGYLRGSGGARPRSYGRNRLDGEQQTARQLDYRGRAYRRGHREILSVQRVELIKGLRDRQKARGLHYPIQTAARVLEDRSQVFKGPARLELKRGARQCPAIGVEAGLTRNEEQLAQPNRLGVRAAPWYPGTLHDLMPSRHCASKLSGLRLTKCKSAADHL